MKADRGEYLRCYRVCKDNAKEIGKSLGVRFHLHFLWLYLFPGEV